MEPRPWHRSYPEGVPPSLEPYPEHSLLKLLVRAAERFPKRPALSFFGRRTSYRRLLAEVERLSASLAALGVGPGDRVGLVLPNCPQFVIGFYAALRLGGIVVPNNPLYTQRELRHQLADAGCKVVVVLDLLYPTLAAVRDELPELETVVVTSLAEAMPRPLRWLAPLRFRREMRRAGRPWPPVPPDAPVVAWRELMRRRDEVPEPARIVAKSDIAGLIYTGGTTGLSKGAMLTHYNLVVNCLQAEAWTPEVEPGREAVLCVLPFFHSYGLSVCMNFGIHAAAKLILLPRFDVDRVLAAIHRERPTLFPGVPRLYIALNESPHTGRYDLSSVKACLSGAAPLPAAVAEKFEGLTGARLVEGYGLTETSPITHGNPLDGRAREGSIGLPFPDTDSRLLDLEDPTREVPAGEAGELAIRGPQVMLGYWRRPDETAACLRAGWFLTGDVARMDEDGFFYIVDRKKDMILVSGFNVYPTEVEEVLYRHPAIEKACVVGVPDETTGEAVKAFVVLRDGAAVSPRELLDWCRDPAAGLAGYRAPRHLEIRDALPETLTGKVLRRALLEEERVRAGA